MFLRHSSYSTRVYTETGRHKKKSTLLIEIADCTRYMDDAMPGA